LSKGHSRECQRDGLGPGLKTFTVDRNSFHYVPHFIFSISPLAFCHQPRLYPRVYHKSRHKWNDPFSQPQIVQSNSIFAPRRARMTPGSVMEFYWRHWRATHPLVSQPKLEVSVSSSAAHKHIGYCMTVIGDHYFVLCRSTA
jgi:hypothetical protein